MRNTSNKQVKLIDSHISNYLFYFKLLQKLYLFHFLQQFLKLLIVNIKIDKNQQIKKLNKKNDPIPMFLTIALCPVPPSFDMVPHIFQM